MKIEIKWRPCAQSHKDLEAVLKRKGKEREGDEWVGVEVVVGGGVEGGVVSGLFWGSGPG